MARKTKAEKEQEALEAENLLNTTREGILVRPGQRWKDMDPRHEGRLVSIDSINAGTAIAFDGKTTRPLAVRRMYPNTRGYSIVGSV